MILSKKLITTMLISLLGCAGWSAPLLFANPKDRFSRVEAHFITSHYSHQAFVRPLALHLLVLSADNLRKLGLIWIQTVGFSGGIPEIIF